MPNGEKAREKPPESPLTGPAFRDFVSILKISGRDFGSAAADRYRALIETAIKDVVADPHRLGSVLHSGNIRTYHIGLSRDRVSGQRVGAPRHILIYRLVENGAEILRILHDARIIARAIPAKYRKP